MLKNDFYFRTIRRYVSVVGTLFSEIDRKTYDADGNLVKIIRVPLIYMPKDKMMARLLTDPNIQKPSALDLPRMSFDMGSPVYAPDRKLNTVNKFVVKNPDDPNSMKQMFMSVPYDFPFTLHIYAKLNEDITKIVEQILPFFKPDWTPTVYLLDEMENKSFDIPIVHRGTSQDIRYEGSFKENQVLIWSMDFVLNGFLFAPIKNKPIIKFVNTNIKVPYPGQSFNEAISANIEPTMTLTIKPGLTANGQPTSNTVESVDVNTIWVDDDFGFCTIIEEN